MFISIRRNSHILKQHFYRYYSADRIFENSKLLYSYFPGGYFDADGAAYFTHTDYQGSIIMVTDSEGKVVQHTSYYPYGEPHREPTGQPYLHGGKERLALTHDYDYIMRRINPSALFWNQPDPCADDYTPISPYVFCAANPVMFNDLMGGRITARDLGVLYDWMEVDGVWGFYDENKNLYQGNNVFMNNLTEALTDLVSKDFGHSLISELVADERVIFVRKVRQDDDKGSSTGPKVVQWNPSKNRNDNDEAVPTTKGAHLDPTMNLGHELGHVHFNWFSDRSREENWISVPGRNTPLSISEIYAMHVENRLRSEHNLPLRRCYLDLLGLEYGKVLKSKNKSIYFDTDGNTNYKKLGKGVEPFSY